MKTRAFGPSRVPVPIVGEGTWNMEQDDPKSVKRAIARSVELGMAHVDTAELYGSGAVEKLVGDAIRDVRREKIFLVSKVMPSNATRKGTVRACEASLRRLGTSYLDVYLLHWPGPHPLEETIAAFEELVAGGKIRAYGVSNFGVEDLEAAVRISGEGKLACNQVLLHLEEREIEHSVEPWCKAHDIAIVAYSPFGSTHAPWKKQAAKKVLEAIAAKHEVTPHAVALAFLTRGDGRFAIPKASSSAHVEANARAGDVVLDAGDVAQIEAAFPKQPERGDVPTL